MRLALRLNKNCKYWNEKKKKNAVYLIKTDLEATLRLIQVANM